MARHNLWMLLLTLTVIGWSVAELIPLKDRPFDQYIQSEAKAYPTEFAAVMKQAEARVASKQAPTVFVALKQIGKEQKVDLSRFFPQIRLEASLRNVERRNSILLDELLKRSKGRLQLGLDLKGGVAFTLEVADRAAGTSARDNEQKLTKAIEIISARINSLGVAEPIVRPIGNNRIDVELAGVSTKDNPEIVSNLKKPARLDFRLVYRGGTPETIPPSEAPPGYEPMTLEQEGRNGEIRTSELYIKRIPEMTGEALSDAYATMDEFGRFKILLRFTKDGAKRFADVTRAIAEENKRTGQLGQLAIILDGKLYSAPTVREEIPSGSAEITGSFTQREAIELANVLNNPLDLPLDIKEQYEVGPSLAQDAINSGILAAKVGAALVAIFMIGYYTTAGMIAITSVAVNVLGILGVLSSLGATMTMPGIAGIVLTIGMAVDAHILIFERMREELNLGKSLTAAFHAGHEKAFTTIVDANLTTLITSVLMIIFGTGPVKGFGITLTIGIFSTMFTALIVSRMLLEIGIESRVLKRIIMMSFLKPPKMDFVKWGWTLFRASWLIVVIGIVAVGIRGHAIYGIDFAGGDEITLTFSQHVDAGRLRSAMEQARVGEVNPLYQSDLSGGHEVLKVQTATGKGEAAVAALTKAFPQAHFTVVGTNTIGPAIGKEIQWNAFLAIGLSIVGIMLYVAFRFEMGYGIGAVVSTIHDVLMTIGIFVLSGRQFNASMVGAILLIVGYSINDTIVVFDRIREELRVNPNGTLRDIINLATNRVFNRSILTSLTTFLAALSLYLFGGGVINDLAFTFLVGIITGTGSSIYIASPIFYWWHKGDRKHVEAHHDIAPKYEWTGSSKASQ
ncbi:MAG TPA: protein translocase subunit SecD [Opitutaceae bacterium]|nr:protein translocase subunit SecD [Opitutaceae bacterium]